jgi:hypothetical protein
MSRMNEATPPTQLSKEVKVRAMTMAPLPLRVAIVSKDVLERLEVADGKDVWAEYQGKRAHVTARAGAVPVDRIELHPEDLKTLGITEGTELVLRPAKQS